MTVKEEQFIPGLFFELKLDVKGRSIGYFTEVSGLTAEIETLTYNEGGRNEYVHRLPTRMKHPNLVLKRGVTTLKELEKWFSESHAGPERTSVTLTMYDQALERIRTWSFQNAYPVKWTGPAFNASQSTVATEAIEIVHDGVTMVP